jgi:hypothetical protein
MRFSRLERIGRKPDGHRESGGDANERLSFET